MGAPSVELAHGQEQALLGKRLELLQDAIESNSVEAESLAKVMRVLVKRLEVGAAYQQIGVRSR